MSLLDTKSIKLNEMCTVPVCLQHGSIRYADQFHLSPADIDIIPDIARKTCNDLGLPDIFEGALIAELHHALVNHQFGLPKTSTLLDPPSNPVCEMVTAAEQGLAERSVTNRPISKISNQTHFIDPHWDIRADFEMDVMNYTKHV